MLGLFDTVKKLILLPMLLIMLFFNKVPAQVINDSINHQVSFGGTVAKLLMASPGQAQYGKIIMATKTPQTEVGY